MTKTLKLLRLCLSLLVFAAIAVIPTAARAAAGVPFTDEYQDGSRTLCNQNEPPYIGKFLPFPSCGEPYRQLPRQLDT